MKQLLKPVIVIGFILSISIVFLFLRDVPDKFLASQIPKHPKSSSWEISEVDNRSVGQKKVAVIEAVISDNEDQVFDFYRQAFSKLGWKIQEDSVMDVQLKSIKFVKGKHCASLSTNRIFDKVDRDFFFQFSKC